MNLLTVPTRKRQRDDDPDFDQSLPISKRINQLHIRQLYDGSETSGPSDNTPWSSNNNVHWVDFPYQIPLPEHHFNTVPATSAPGFHVPFGTNAQDPASFNAQGFPNHRFDMENLPAAAYCCPTNEDFDDPNKMRYEPELSPTENPFYYAANEHLFHLHVERLRRQRNV